MGLQTQLVSREKNKKIPTLSLVSLMDIFTILVFFLLMNSGDTQQIEKATFITLPDSQAKGSFHDDLVIMVGSEFIMINDEKIVDVSKVMKNPGKAIPELGESLIAFADKKGDLTDYEKKNGLAVTIMGDQSVDYSLLKSVMTTCSQKDFRDISLAVNQVVGSVMAAGG